MIPGYNIRMNLAEVANLGRTTKAVRDRFPEDSDGWKRWDGHLTKVRARYNQIRRYRRGCRQEQNELFGAGAEA